MTSNMPYNILFHYCHTQNMILFEWHSWINRPGNSTCRLKGPGEQDIRHTENSFCKVAIRLQLTVQKFCACRCNPSWRDYFMSGFSFKPRNIYWVPTMFQVLFKSRNKTETSLLWRLHSSKVRQKQTNKPMLGVDQVLRKHIHQVKQKGKPWCGCRDGSNFI